MREKNKWRACQRNFDLRFSQLRKCDFRLLVFGFSEVGVLGGMKPGKDLSPPETLKKAGAAEQVRDIKDLRKKAGADPEQSRSRMVGQGKISS
jgi:hypothetical protein